MADPTLNDVCKSCGFSGQGNYCSQCGQPYKVKRLSLTSLLHDIFHLFTHLEKGFLFTLKQLIVAPGSTQREYIDGDRIRYQKPFSMFFICATISALTRYISFELLIKFYNTGSVAEAEFWRQGMVILQVFLMPLFILLAYLFFRNSPFNYAELGVVLLYAFSVFFLAAALLNLSRFIWARLDIAYIEFPLYSLYFVITFVNFFHDKNQKWLLILKSLCLFLIIFFLIQVIEDFVINKFY